MTTRYSETFEFKKEWKKLSRKYRTLREDLDNFKQRMHEVDVQANKNFAVLFGHAEFKIIKARLFCRSLKGNSLRIIYAVTTKGDIEFIHVDFIEIYFKGDKEREDRERIERYIKSR